MGGVRTTVLATEDLGLTILLDLFLQISLLQFSEAQARSELGGVETTVLATGDYDVEQVDGHGGAKF